MMTTLLRSKKKYSLFLTLIAVIVALVLAHARGQEAKQTLLLDEVGLYPRLVRLENNDANNGRIIASVVTFSGNNGLGAIFESADAGQSFTRVGTVSDHNAEDGKGLCCATLYELPVPIGDLPAGTLLWAASFGQDSGPNRRMELRIWQSGDLGRTWSYLSRCAVAANGGGLWEPEFSVASDGSLVCHYADETDSAHSQKLEQVRSVDGVHWLDQRDTVASEQQSDRPGMPMVRQLSDGTYLMSYEICSPDPLNGCSVYYRTSPDGWDWGDPTDPGTRPETADGKFFRHAPTLAWGLGDSPDGQLFLVGQILQNSDGTTASGNGKTIFVNTEKGEGFWSEINAPVHIYKPYNNYCPNYSSPLLPLGDSSLLMIATDFDGTRCKAYFGTGSTK